jgi:hypothetical protein
LLKKRISPKFGAKAMRATPLFLSACTLAAIGGIVSGATINTRIIQQAGIGMNEIQRPAIDFDPSDTGLSDQVAPPDHYALGTPEGRIEVAELSMRGLYSQRRFGWDAAWVPPPPPALPEPAADPDWSYQGQGAEIEPAVAIEPAVDQSSADVGTPDPASTGQARTVVVQAALADKAKVLPVGAGT